MGSEEAIIEERKRKVKEFFSRTNIWVYVILAVLVVFAFWTRSLNTDKLRDVTTNDWTLGPDLDPFLFLRWAKTIVANGSLPAIDTMRYVPLGFDTRGEMMFLPYLIAWFHKFLDTFGLTSGVTESAVYYPVFAFCLTVIAFFFLTRRIAKRPLGERNANIVALIGCFFLTVIPALLTRTIAGIPEKESAAFFFMFLAFYFYLEGWESKTMKSNIVYGVLAGLSTAAMALDWGGFIYIPVVMSLVLLVAMILGKIDKNKLIMTGLCIFVAYAVMGYFSSRYTPFNLLTYSVTLAPVMLLIISSLDLAAGKYDWMRFVKNEKLRKIPRPVFVLIVLALLGIILSIVIMGPAFMKAKLQEVTKPIIQPISDRFGVTVAENRQPFFSEWANSFGPTLGGKFPLYFWLFIIGAIYIYYKMIWVFEKKERVLLTLAYSFFLFATIFSRYSPSSVLNGTNGMSIGLYLLGVIVFVGSFGYYYFKVYSTDKEKLKEIDIGLILLFSLFFFSIVFARGSVRTIMVLVPAVSIIVPYFIVSFVSKVMAQKDDSSKTMNIFIAGILVLALIYSAFSTFSNSPGFFEQTVGTAQNFAPYAYTFQWQKAMKWVRDNSASNAVFAHWWDYGYWVQSIGERATVLDGGNAIGYWNHLMGRLALTAPNVEAPLQYFYTHKVTHFLIDSTDIGKYSAFSSIGSDENYDRYGYIPTFVKDYNQQRETKNGTLFVYSGNGYAIDSDIMYDMNGTMLFLPGGKAGIIAILVELDKQGNINQQPKAVIAYNNAQYQLPMRYAYVNEFKDFGSGIDSGIYVFPRLLQQGNSQGIDNSGAALYLSNRTVKSQLARLYLYNEENPYFKLVHSEDSYLVSQVKAINNATNNDIIFFGDIQGPIKIWEVKYPAGIEANESYLNKDYPNKLLNVAR